MTLEEVVAVAAGQGVGPVTAEQTIVAGVPLHDVIAALPQRRYIDGKNAKSLKYIVANFTVDDQLLKALRDIIKDQEFLRRQTAEWGKRLILDADSAKLDKNRIARLGPKLDAHWGIGDESLRNLISGLFY